MKNFKGAIACGHPEVAKAAEVILKSGGNAFDAVVAAQFSACVVEPVLTSLGGGGYLNAWSSNGRPCVYDFFVQTPTTKRQEEPDFYPVMADFGDVTQEFHIGIASAATPGTVKGAFSIHKDLCSMPMTELVQPAIQQAKEGVAIAPMQAYIFDVVAPIYRATESAREVFLDEDGKLPREGLVFTRPELADTLDSLAREGAGLFYQGEIAASIENLANTGGHLTRQDFDNYEVILRRPLSVSYRDATMATNSPPSFGGILIAFAMRLLSACEPGKWGSERHLRLLNKVMALTQKARVDKVAAGGLDKLLLDEDYLSLYRSEVLEFAATLRGTTHISIADAAGNMAAMSLSNGEGCGAVVPGTGFMLNNMLGEEDINPTGFGRWQENQRMASMMSPTILTHGDVRYALGSGGSNRIRSAILQVVSNLVDFNMPIEQAIESPRLHHESGELNVEGGIDVELLASLDLDIDQLIPWQGLNLFFGGVHVVEVSKNEMRAHGDPRRGGVGMIVS
jgi:gamma-glutamyltranspeptidase/glutathione hydrolase